MFPESLCGVDWSVVEMLLWKWSGILNPHAYNHHTLSMQRSEL